MYLKRIFHCGFISAVNFVNVWVYFVVRRTESGPIQSSEENGGKDTVLGESVPRVLQRGYCKYYTCSTCMVVTFITFGSQEPISGTV